METWVHIKEKRTTETYLVNIRFFSFRGIAFKNWLLKAKNTLGLITYRSMYNHSKKGYEGVNWNILIKFSLYMKWQILLFIKFF